MTNGSYLFIDALKIFIYKVSVSNVHTLYTCNISGGINQEITNSIYNTHPYNISLTSVIEGSALIEYQGPQEMINNYWVSLLSSNGTISHELLMLNPSGLVSSYLVKPPGGIGFDINNFTKNTTITLRQIRNCYNGNMVARGVVVFAR
jgi:hypothetical protein